jgi:ankyrin repeat domain-containing protein 50
VIEQPISQKSHNPPLEYIRHGQRPKRRKVELKFEADMLKAQQIESAIDRLNMDELPQILSAVDQEQHKSRIPSLSYNQPNFYWILRNADLEDWSSDTCSQVLWLSGPPKCNIDQVSSYVVDVEKKKASETQHSVLYFFCLTADTENPIVSFTHSLLYQIVRCSPSNERAQIVKTFLHSLRDAILGKKQTSNTKLPQFQEGDSPRAIIKKVLDAETNGLWGALKAVLDSAHSHDLSIVIDGLDRVKRRKVEFVREVRELVEHLQGRISKVKALFTSRPEAEIKEVLDGLPCIEYDKERKGSATPPDSDSKLSLPY